MATSGRLQTSEAMSVDGRSGHGHTARMPPPTTKTTATALTTEDECHSHLDNDDTTARELPTAHRRGTVRHNGMSGEKGNQTRCLIYLTQRAPTWVHMDTRQTMFVLLQRTPTLANTGAGLHRGVKGPIDTRISSRTQRQFSELYSYLSESD
jgi:hypothetical protein